VRCFDDENVTFIYETIDPVRDIETIDLELIFADLELIERRYERVQKMAKSDKSLRRQEEILGIIKATLEGGRPARTLAWEDADDIKFVKSLTLITQKPVLFAANISENQINGSHDLKPLEDYVKSENMKLFTSCAKLEAELATLEAEEKAAFMEDLGIQENGLAKLISSGYELLGLISFFTAGPKEVRAWTVRHGAKAPEAAGKIHSDLERGFIRAEVVAFTDLTNNGSYNGAKEKGLVRIEGKEYIVKDGDVVLIRFNV
jgi:GTP-binding protein YchF